MLGTPNLGLLGLNSMSTNASDPNESTATELTDFDPDAGPCDECANLADGFPCADCYISDRKDFQGA